MSSFRDSLLLCSSRETRRADDVDIWRSTSQPRIYLLPLGNTVHAACSGEGSSRSFHSCRLIFLGPGASVIYLNHHTDCQIQSPGVKYGTFRKEICIHYTHHPGFVPGRSGHPCTHSKETRLQVSAHCVLHDESQACSHQSSGVRSAEDQSYTEAL
jgi:hypothetical protein